MDAYDLKEILFACGSGLTHLEVSLTVGEISRDILKLAPNVTQLVAHHTLLAPNMTTGMSDVEGNVSLEAISNALMGIPMPDLLALIRASSHAKAVPEPCKAMLALRLEEKEAGRAQMVRRIVLFWGRMLGGGICHKGSDCSDASP
eukprot:gene29952-38600_t